MKLKAIMLLLLISALLVSCSGLQAAPVKRAPLRVEFTQWWGDYTLIIAQQKGFFEKNNVEVELVYYPVFNDALPEITAGYLDGGLVSIGDALNISSFAPIKVVAVYDAGGTNDVVAAPAIRSILDLKGKSIGVPLGSPYELYILEMLRNGGVRSTDVKLVNITPDQVPDAIPSQIQAGYVWSPYTEQAIAKGNHILSSSGYISGLFPDVIVFHNKVIEERPEDIRAFLTAWFEAVDFRQNNPDEANQIISEYLNIPLSQVKGNARILNLQQNIDIFGNTPPAGLPSIQQTAQTNAEFLLRIGTMSKLPDYKNLLTDEFLK